MAIIFFLVDDIRRVIQWLAGKLFYNNTEAEIVKGDGISRSVFLSWLGLGIGGGLFGSLVYGFGNKYKYDIKRVKLSFDNLPAGFKGMKLLHISDIHSGSFTDKKAVLHGVNEILNEKAVLCYALLCLLIHHGGLFSRPSSSDHTVDLLLFVDHSSW